MASAAVRRTVAYLGALSMDLYYPPDRPSGLLPAVVIVLGYPDVGVTTPFGCQFREMGMTISWAQLFAALGMVGIVYETRDPAQDAFAVLSYIRENGETLGIDSARIGVWSSSGNVPVALSVLMDGKARCGVLCYGAMLDLDGATSVAQAAAQFHFAIRARVAVWKTFRGTPRYSLLERARISSATTPWMPSLRLRFAPTFLSR